jgi:acyl dehydratase
MSDGYLEPLPLEEAMAAVGQEIGVSPWRLVSQEMIDKFAVATDDHQFIHVDPLRAAAESPFGGTIAHGFLSLSLLSTLAYETVRPIKGAGMGVNYGFDKVRFASPIKSGARIRARFKLAELTARPSGWVHVNYDVTVEIEGSIKPAFTARWLTLAVMEKAKEDE